MVLAFLLMLVIVAGMAVGVAMGRKPIAGSCGGMQNLGLDGGCACGRTPGSCQSDPQGLEAIPKARQAAHELAVDAAPRDRRGARTV